MYSQFYLKHPLRIITDILKQTNGTWLSQAFLMEVFYLDDSL